jgi:hypothetical protein
MHRFIIFIMGSAIVALALAVISISTVAVMAQTMALLSQCLLALGMIGVGLIVASSVALRNRVIQVYLARRLLGAKADRVLAQSPLDRPATFPEAFLQKQIDQPSSAITMLPLRQTPSLSMPAVPQGWGFDEED